jgi:hypothetical protein
MVRFSSLLLCTGALIAGCASETSTDVARGSAQVIDVSDCVKIEGADIGRTITLEVPDADGEGTVSITFTGWVAKDGEDGEFVGFTLDGDATFVVKAGTEQFEGSGDSWTNPNGTGGSAAKGISYVAICTGDDGEEPPPPPPDDECDDNDDGDHTDEGECDYVPPPPPPDDECDGNGDGDHTDEGECDYVPPPPPDDGDCDHNDDGDTTDDGECNAGGGGGGGCGGDAGAPAVES